MPLAAYPSPKSPTDLPKEPYFYPDTSATCLEPEFVEPKPRSLANPQVIVEVLSRTTERYDRGDKWSAYRMIPTLTVEENILLPAWAGDAQDAPAQLARIYRTIPELDALRSRKALQLSGGQQKLVALGRALMAGRKLLLLDEPFEGVAPVLARRLADVIAGLRQSGLSVILAESSMTHAHGLLDRVFTIDRGAVSVRS